MMNQHKGKKYLFTGADFRAVNANRLALLIQRLDLDHPREPDAEFILPGELWRFLVKLASDGTKGTIRGKHFALLRRRKPRKEA